MTATETAPKGKRGEAPFIVEYVNDKGETSSRIPENVNGLKITDRAKNESKTYSFEGFNDAVMMGLAAAGYNRQFQTAIRNSVGDDGEVNIIEVADRIQGNLLQGKVYSRTGSGKGKVSKRKEFDIEFWTDVGTKFLASLSKDKTVDANILQRFLTKIEAIDPRSRKSTAERNPAMRAAYSAVIAQRTAAEARKAPTTDFDLDEMFAEAATE